MSTERRRSLLSLFALLPLTTVSQYACTADPGEVADAAPATLTQPAAGFAEPDDVSAPQMSPLIPGANGYLARIALNSPEDVEKALLRAEQLYKEGQVSGADNPLAFVLHGPEVAIFFKENYPKYKNIVDLAARLSAFQVVDVRVCETRMGVLGREKDALLPFVDTVRFGPAEIDRLLKQEKYVYF